MKHRVFLIAAALCAAVFALNTTGCSSEEATAPALPYVSAEGVTTAEIELIPPAGAKAGGDFHFSFLTGKVEWTPGMIPLVVGDHPPKQERGPAELPFSMMGEADMKSVPVVILSESEIKSILSTGDFPEKKAATNPDRLNRESFYVLKDETDHSFYVFRLKDNSPKYVWQQIEYVRIGEGESWKENENPGLSALVKSASNTKTGTSRSIEKKKTNAETTRQKIIQAWREKNDADRRKGKIRSWRNR